MSTPDAAPSNLAESLQAEITRVRAIDAEYAKIGAPGEPARFMMGRSLDAAVKALAEGDAVACVRSFEDLRGYSL